MLFPCTAITCRHCYLQASVSMPCLAWKTLALPKSDSLGETSCVFLAYKTVSEELSPKQRLPGGIWYPR